MCGDQGEEKESFLFEKSLLIFSFVDDNRLFDRLINKKYITSLSLAFVLKVVNITLYNIFEVVAPPRTHSLTSLRYEIFNGVIFLFCAEIATIRKL